MCTFYKDDIEKQQLKCQLPLLKMLVKESLESPNCERELSIHFITKQLSDLSLVQRVAFSQVFVVANLLLVLPATNASSEHSFYALRRVKPI